MTFANGDTENGVATKSGKIESGSAKYHLQTVKTVLNTLAHMLIGLVCILTLFFTFYDGLPTYMPNIHVALTVLGVSHLVICVHLI